VTSGAGSIPTKLYRHNVPVPLTLAITSFATTPPPGGAFIDDAIGRSPHRYIVTNPFPAGRIIVTFSITEPTSDDSTQ
jgi:hypothetical protein